MNKLNNTILAGALVVAAGSGAVADPRRELGTAQGFDITLASTTSDLARVRVEEDGIERLRQTDQDQTTEQAGVAFTPDGTKAWYWTMKTGPINEGTAMQQDPPNNMQCAMSILQLGVDATGSFTVQRAADAPYDIFVTDNDGEEHRNCNNPFGFPIMNGKYLALEFNYRPNNNTERYVSIIDQQNNIIPINGQRQALVQRKNNDDLSGGGDGGGRGMVTYDSATETRWFAWDLGNGNGRDAGWARETRITCTGEGPTAACTTNKVFDLVLAEEEERTRGHCSVGGADRSFGICTWTEGDDQPADRGVWIAAVDLSANAEQGEEADSRLLWKHRILRETEMVVNGQARQYIAMRANHTRELAMDAAGNLSPTNRVLFQTSINRGNNTQDRKGGRPAAVLAAVYEVTREGFTETVPLTNIQPLLLGFDSTHTPMTGAIFGKGADVKPGFTMIQGEHTAQPGSSEIRTIMWDPITRNFVDMGQHALGRSSDRHLYSNYLGNNPGEQGRNFSHCKLVKNPYSAMNGNNVTYFQACALTGKSILHPQASVKTSAFLSIFPVAFTKEAPPPGGGWNEEDLPGEDNPTQGGDDEPGTSVGGCSTSSGANGLLFALALGLATFIRRRK
jgi:MYXO-CTERM domain-containing protein